MRSLRQAQGKLFDSVPTLFEVGTSLRMTENARSLSSRAKPRDLKYRPRARNWINFQHVHPVDTSLRADYSRTMVPQWIIEKKRDGLSLEEGEIRFLVDGYAGGTIPDYQMSAFAMAVLFRGMSFDEVAVLTDAIMRSGEVLDTSPITRPKVDKHSTGGIGDKVSLVLAPLVACCGVTVPMISGRGLGITGGTLDKLESIPGYRTGLASSEFMEVLGECGCSIIGQTAELAPADRKLYALRDVTGTVPSIPLISASIMSKKLAENTDALVLDVKWGKGAFMKTVEDARELARIMVEIGARMNKGMAAVITDMNQPLGKAAGNSVEIAETVDALQGRGPADLMAVTFELASHMLLLAGVVDAPEQALAMLDEQLQSGAAFARFKRMVELHGGNVDVLEDTSLLPSAKILSEYPSPESGYVSGVDSELIGKACALLGAGRETVEDPVDHAVGVTGTVKIGEQVEKGQPLLTLHASEGRRLDGAAALLEKAFAFSPEPPRPPQLIVETVLPEGGNVRS